MFFVVLYFFLLLIILPALVRNLKFRSKAGLRLERYGLKFSQRVGFRSLSLALKKLDVCVSKSLVTFSLFTSFVHFYVLKSSQFLVLNNLLIDSFSNLAVKKNILWLFLKRRQNKWQGKETNKK